MYIREREAKRHRERKTETQKGRKMLQLHAAKKYFVQE